MNIKEIREVALKYCMDTLANDQPDHEYEDETKKWRKMVKQFMLSKNGDFEASKETFLS